MYNRTVLPSTLTTSLCPCCYAVIPAQVTVMDNGVWITKQCPDHGPFTAMVERDPQWYHTCQLLQSTNIYSGYFIDVTGKCNIQCKYCYHENKGGDQSVDAIIADGVAQKHLAPFLLTGGEPTLHPDLPRIVKELSDVAETWVLTNGMQCTEQYMQVLCGNGLLGEDGVIRMGLSLHPESEGKDVKLLKLCRKKGWVMGSVMYVIDDLNQIPPILDFYHQYKDVIGDLRIKAASNLWSEQKARNPIFVSDMINYLRGRGNVRLLHDGKRLCTKASYANIMWNDLFLVLVSWYNAGNVDLNDINCSPYYKAKDGGIYNFATTAIMNEGLESGGGVVARRARGADLEEISHLWVNFIKEGDADSAPNREEWLRRAATLIKNRNYYLLVSTKEGKITGFQDGVVTLEPSINKMCVMGRDFYVGPEHRTGPSTRLLNALTMKFGKRAGVTDIIRLIRPSLLDYWTKKGCKVTNIMIRTGYVGGN